MKPAPFSKMRTRKEIYTLFSRIILASVYLSFFIVQFFFNFDSQGGPVSNVKSFTTQAAIPIKSKLDNWEGKNHRIAPFRLNKRFQPAASTSFAGFESALPKHETPAPIAVYHSPRLAKVVLLLQSLRAPPATNLP